MKPVPILALVVVLSAFFALEYFHESSIDDAAYRGLASVPAEVQDLYDRFIQNDYYQSEESNAYSYQGFVSQFNQTMGTQNPVDWVDAFIGSLPEKARKHYTFVHRSYSIQSGTPMSPRVILFTPDARTMMTFNSKLDEKGQVIPGTTGDQSVEVIQWNLKTLSWDFAELVHDGRQINVNKNPARCVMCHAGTPKPLLDTHTDFYQGKLKPIFPQYPFWPGFYGSVNDIVGLPGTEDTIMADLKSTRGHINDFLFDDSEELRRLREALDKNPKYIKVVEDEMKIHQAHFSNFIKSMEDRPRYRHLIPLSKLYTDKGEAVPDFLKSAPYRRNFSKDYGHYIFRPNFYLSSLMTFYQAQAIAREIMAFPEYERIKYSLLAAKFNCSGAYDLKSQSGNLGLVDLNPSFDLLYPNVSSQATRDHQYLLAYQYNPVHSAKTGTPHLPLFSWNLEGNEDIASYHYGNVFSDLNELVLWNLAANSFQNIEIENGRNAHEARHADFNVKNHIDRNNAEMEIFDKALLANSGHVSRFTQSQMDFSTKRQKYYGIDSSGHGYKGLPVSKHCKNDFLPAAQQELDELAQSREPLPHEKFKVDVRLTDISHVPNQPDFQPIALNGTRQACEACHTSGLIQPQLNTDWHSDDYFQTVKEGPTPWFRQSHLEPMSLKDKMLLTLDPNETLPVPFGNLMPFGRRAMDPFSLLCEQKLIEVAHRSNRNNELMEDKFNCQRRLKQGDGVQQVSKSGPAKLEIYPQTPENIENCRCRSLYIRKHAVAADYYHLE